MLSFKNELTFFLALRIGCRRKEDGVQPQFQIDSSASRISEVNLNYVLLLMVHDTVVIYNNR